MKWINLLMALAGSLVGRVYAVDAALLEDVKLPFGNGKITLNRGTVVTVEDTRGNFLTISFRNVRGKVARLALDLPEEAPAGHSAYPLVDSPTPSLASFRDATAAMIKSIKPLLAQVEVLVIEGKTEEANQMLLDFIPSAERTAAQNFVLGNILYKASSANSFVLHKKAAQQAPEVPEVLFEWALEQHRRKDYAHALRTYYDYSQRQPDFSPAYGLAAECALRTGHVPEAIALYQKFERASRGAWGEFETLVCEVNGGIYVDGERAQLLKRALRGEESAAKTLLLIDTTWKADWWRASVEPKRLKHDLEVTKGVFPRSEVDLTAACCVAQIALLDPDALPAKKRELIVAAGLLFDRDGTLPHDGAVLSALLRIATEFVDVPTLRTTFGKRVRELAKQTKNAETYDAAAYLYSGTDDLADIDQAGWDDTHHARFAISRLYGLYKEHNLTIDHLLIERARKEFLYNSEIESLVVKLAVDAKLPLRSYLGIALRSEYLKFSTDRSGAGLSQPSSDVLRGYFFELDKLQTAARGP